MMKQADPVDFYEALSILDKSIIDDWNNRRETHLRDRMMGEMNAKLEEYCQDTTCPSTRFLRIRVRGVDDFTESGRDAILTIWNPSDDQLAEIKEGSVLRVKTIHVKPGLFEGLMQLSARSVRILKQKVTAQAVKKSYANFFRLFVASCRIKVDKSTTKTFVEDNALGIIVSAERLNENRWSVLLVDESGVLLEIKSDVGCAHLWSQITSLSGNAVVNTQQNVVAAFQQIRICGVNAEQSCVFARFQEVSSIDLNPPSDRLVALKLWSSTNRGRARLVQLAACCQLAIRQTPKCQYKMVGYVSGLHLLPDQQLILQIDRGNACQTLLKFPLSLVSRFAESCDDLTGFVFLTEDDEMKIKQLKRLGRILRCRRWRYIFSVRNIVDPIPNFDDIDMEVTSLTPANTVALVALYSTVRKLSASTMNAKKMPTIGNNGK